MSDRVMESIPLIGSLVQAGAGVAGVVLSALGLRKRDPARRSPSTDDASTVFGDQARGNIVAGDYASVATRGGVAAARVNITAHDTHFHLSPPPAPAAACHFVGRDASWRS